MSALSVKTAASAGVDADGDDQTVAQADGVLTTSRWPLVTGSKEPG
jgi:hypothetical protein